VIDTKPKRPGGAPPNRPRTLDVTAAATPAAIAQLRHSAADFANVHGADPKLTDDVALAVSEAVTNVVKYAYGPGPKDTGEEVKLYGEVSNGWLELRVCDGGEGFGRGSSEGLGLGLSIMASLSAELTIVQEGEGTEVRMRFPMPGSSR
jgi:serine/threonine-protein kinase RsbW